MARALRSFVVSALLGVAAMPAGAMVLYSHPDTVTVNDNALGAPLPGFSLHRDDSANDTLYFRFVVRPISDRLTEPYLAGLQLFADAESPGLGVGNSLESSAYSAFSPALGTLDLNSATPDPGLLTRSVRRGDVTTFVMRLKYNPGALDAVTVWLAPDSTQVEGAQPSALTTSFATDASFTTVHLREESGGAGWMFSRIAVATRMSDLFGPLPFTDATTSVLADTSLSSGVTWVDVDGDGDLDLCLANADAASRVYRNDGGGVFSAQAVAPLDTLTRADAMTWGDYDNDGDLDLYVAQYALPNHLLRNDGLLRFTDVTGGPLGNAGATTAAVWGDYDRDGRLDLYLTSFTGSNRLLRNQGGGAFTDVTSGPLAGPGASVSAAWGDYDDDGDLDLYVANFNRPNQLLRNDGNGVFVDATTGPLGDAGYGFGVAWGDLDNDGDLDLVLINDGGPSKVFRNDRLGVFTDVTKGPLAATGAGISVAIGDVDDDGDLDLYVTRYGEPNQLFRNDGGFVFTDVNGGPLGDPSFSTGAAWGDYDGDGDLDLYVANDGYSNRLLRNEQSNGNHWLEVKLRGTSSNRAGIGARVRLVSGGVTRIRELSGGSGYGCQDALMAAFGLGATARLDSMSVRWPSGIEQWLLPPPALDRVITVTEPPMALEVGDGTGLTGPIALAPASPNPFRTRTHIGYDLPRAGAVTVTVLDVQGRRVATLADGMQLAGPHSATWAGLDAAGHEASAGLYWVRLAVVTQSGRETKVTKLVLAR